MPTSGGYVSPAAPPCPYIPRMTRAAALALRAANGLLENCVVVITDGPTIGTAGNTSVTEITLQPVSPTEFSENVSVNTTFDNEAWAGRYNIDDNSITELVDNFNNRVRDTDAGAATVHTQWPWHLSSVGGFIRDNVVEDAVLTGADTGMTAGGGFFRDNIVGGATLNFTGKTAGDIYANDFGQGVQVFLAGSTTMRNTKFRTADTSLNTMAQNTAGGTLTINDCELLGNFAVINQSTGTVTLTNSQFIGHSPGVFDIQNQGTSTITIAQSEIITIAGVAQSVINQSSGCPISITSSKIIESRVQALAGATGSITLFESELSNDAGVAIAVLIASATNTGAILFSASKLVAGTMTFNGAAATIHDTVYRQYNSTIGGGTYTVSRCDFTLGTYTNSGTGAFTAADSTVRFSNFTRTAGSTAIIQVHEGSQLEDVNVNQGAGATGGTLNINSSRLAEVVLTQNGIGELSIDNSNMTFSNATVAATATRGLGIVNGSNISGSNITQNRTLAGAATDFINGSRVDVSTINILGAAGGAPSTNLLNASTVEGSSTINATDPPSGIDVGNCHIGQGSILNLNAGGFINNSQIGGNCTVNTGAFGHNQLLIWLAGTHTLTAANTNRQRTKGFSDII